MNQLLANYDAARKAIFDHCGVTDSDPASSISIEVIEAQWLISVNDRISQLTLCYDMPDGRKYHSIQTLSEFDQPGRVVISGESVTLVMADVGDFDPEFVIYALDNAMEIKP